MLARQHKSPKTVKAYLYWIERYIDFLCRRRPTGESERKIGLFLSDLASSRRVAKSTQKVALNAVVYLYQKVIGVELGDLSFLKSHKAERLPEVFSREEAWSILDQLDGVHWLWGALMYGCGFRLSEVYRLRFKDIRLDQMQIMVRAGKGDKDRVVPLPELLVEPLKKHLRKIVLSHKKYSKDRTSVSLPGALDKKYPNAPYSLEWFWLFPGNGPSKDPKWKGKLHHIHPTALQRQIRKAIRAAGIHRHASCHTFRHSFATHWLENANGSHDVAIKKLQSIMGHKDVRTTMRYLHIMKKAVEVPSPLDTRDLVNL